MKAKLLTNNPVERLMVIHLTKQQLSTISYLTLQWKNKVDFNCIKLQQFKMFISCLQFVLLDILCSLWLYFPLTKSELLFRGIMVGMDGTDPFREKGVSIHDLVAMWTPVCSELHFFILIFHMDIRLRNLDLSTDYIFSSLILQMQLLEGQGRGNFWFCFLSSQ